MRRAARVEIDVHLDDSGTLATMQREIREGLTGTSKSLPSKYFYDERGSGLFERITELPEYYLTRAEQRLLERHADEIAESTRPQELVELGPGSAKKTRLLIDALLTCGSLRRYVPVEVSPEIAEQSAHELAARYPGLAVHAVVGDFERHLGKVPDGGRRLIALLGSTIGNFRDDEAIELLTNVRALMDAGDWFLLGVDLVKERAILEAAYNDAQGVTAEFNRNILNVVNRRLDADFDLTAFEHVAFYDEEHERIESYLRSVRQQTVRIGALDLDVNFEADELLSTEVSGKYTLESTTRLLEAAGMRLRRWLVDPAQTFGLVIASG